MRAARARAQRRLTAPPPSAEAVSAAVRLAKDSHLDLTRHAAKKYHCVVPEELQKGKGDASRMAGGQLYEAWKLHPEAAGWAQPVLGASVFLDIERCAGTAQLRGWARSLNMKMRDQLSLSV